MAEPVWPEIFVGPHMTPDREGLWLIKISKSFDLIKF